MIEVVKGGLFSTVQDRGRQGYQAYGVPVSGVMDRQAAQIANLLAGNPADAALLEMTLLGGSFRMSQAQWVALAGADMQATLNGLPVANWSAFLAPAGAELSFGAAVSGCRAYLAVTGGIAVAPVLGSRSTYVRGALGGVDGRALQAGDRLPVGRLEHGGQSYKLPVAQQPKYPAEITVRVLLGPQADRFTEDGIETLLRQPYAISTDADRMGYRMDGAVIEHAAPADIVSDALCMGAIQVPAHGQPIVMMADRQTTGGYAKIGVVIGPDLPRLAQAKPGDSVRFVRCSDEEAVAALREERDGYRQLQAAVAAARANTVRQFRLRIDGCAYQLEIEEA